jgi:hypothetical protein
MAVDSVKELMRYGTDKGGLPPPPSTEGSMAPSASHHRHDIAVVGKFCKWQRRQRYYGIITRVQDDEGDGNIPHKVLGAEFLVVLLQILVPSNAARKRII